MTHLLRAAGGQGQPIDRAKVRRLMGLMRADTFVSATLAGALVSKDKDGYIICRDPVAVKGRDGSSPNPPRDQIPSRFTSDIFPPYLGWAV